MPQVRTFKKGSIIYFDGEAKSNVAFLLQAGNLTRVKLSPESVQPERTPLRVGEFFGIKAALGVLPRDETIQVATDTTVYVFTPPEFEAVIKKNVTIIFKMLRAFSNELRRIHHAIEGFMHGEGSSVDGDAGLFGIGQYYFNQKSYAQARYALTKYLEHYPGGASVSEAGQILSAVEEILAGEPEQHPQAVAIKEEVKNPAASAPSKAAPAAAPAAAKAPAAAAAPGADFLLLESKESYEPVPGDDTGPKALREAAFAFSKKEWVKAEALAGKASPPPGAPWPATPAHEKILLMIARLKYYQKKYDDAIAQSKEFVKTFKSSPFAMAAMVVIAESYKAKGQDDLAKSVYSKVIASAADAALKAGAQERLAALG